VINEAAKNGESNGSEANKTVLESSKEIEQNELPAAEKIV
jgi:hypothetical protein